MKTFYPAQSLLLNAWDGKIPVDVVTLASKCGVIVTELANSGNICRTVISKGQIAIVVEKMFPSGGKRYMIAHALGHILLRHGETFFTIPEMVDNFFTGTMSPLEIEANKYAREILIPADTLRHSIEKTGIAEFEILANMFDVSEVAMLERLRELGIVN